MTGHSLIDVSAIAALPRLLLPGKADAPHVAWGRRLLSLLLVVALAGGAAALVALLRGHLVMGTTSELPWGVLIATYLFFVASASGLCLVGSLGHVFGFALFAPLAKKATLLALVMLLVGFSVIASELERPFLLAKLAVLSPNPASPIWWMGVLYGVYLVALAAELFLLLREDHRRARVAGLAALLLAVAAQSNLGAVFSLMHARPLWYGPFVPVYFIALAALCGSALLVLVTWLGDFFTPLRGLAPRHAALLEALRKLLALFLCVAIFFTAWRQIALVQGGHRGQAEVALLWLAGPLFLEFWLLQVFLGLAVPLVLLLGPWRRSAAATALAAALALAGVLAMRFEFVVAGQMLSLKPLSGALGERLAYAPPFKGNGGGLLPYTPSTVEVLIVAGALCAAALLFLAGTRLLRLDKEVP